MSESSTQSRRRTGTERHTIVVVRSARFRYEWSVESPYGARVRRGTALTARGARRLALRNVFEFPSWDRTERIEAQIARSYSMSWADDPAPLPREIL